MLEICLRTAPSVEHHIGADAGQERWLFDTMDSRRQLIEARDALNRRLGAGSAFIAERPLGSVRQAFSDQPIRGPLPQHALSGAM
jgi:hypothetical protein